MIKPDDIALCREADPELWFPNPADFRATTGTNRKARERAGEKVLLAMSICARCPLFANGECLEMAMSDMTTIEYGIWGGTLPLERLNAVGIDKSVNGNVWQHEVRRRAAQEGIIKPLIAKRERPKSSLWDYLDPRLLNRYDSA